MARSILPLYRQVCHVGRALSKTRPTPSLQNTVHWKCLSGVAEQQSRLREPEHHLPVERVVTEFPSDEAINQQILQEIKLNGAVQPELIRRRGYPLEDHSVRTSDGYILNVKRIPHGRTNASLGRRQPIFLMHGLLHCSSIFVMNNPSESLGFILADMGFDVWMGNARGNVFSRQHETLSTDSSEFWDFRLDDISLKDLPSMVDYVLEATGFEQLTMMPYSLGTMNTLAMLSYLPEYNQKVKKCLMIAPFSILHLSWESSPEILHAYISIYNKLFGPTHAVFPTPDSYHSVKEDLRKDPASSFICFTFDYKLLGDKRIKQEMIPLYDAVYPAGLSSYAFFQCAQNQLSRKFSHYDFGEEKNQRLYGQADPPEFPLEKVTTPVAMISSKWDGLCTPGSVEFIRKRIPNIIFDHVITDKKFGHPHFVYSSDAVQLVYAKIFPHLPSPKC